MRVINLTKSLFIIIAINKPTSNFLACWVNLCNERCKSRFAQNSL